MRNYQEDLKREAKNWISYEECIEQHIEQHYKNQEQKMMNIVRMIIENKWPYGRKTESYSMNSRQIWMDFYKERYYSDAKETIISILKEALKKYYYSEDNDLEIFLTESIPVEYLKPYEALNRLGLSWNVDKEKEEYKEYVWVSVTEMCYEKCKKKYEEEYIDELILKIMGEILKSYDTEKGTLGKFVSCRIPDRMNDILRKRNYIKEKTERVPEDKELEIEGFIEVTRITNMERVYIKKDLEKGKYLIEGNKIYFSEEEKGKEIKIKYKEIKFVSLDQIIDYVKDDDKALQKIQDEIIPNQEDWKSQELAWRAIEIVARFINLGELYNGKYRMSQEKIDKMKMCFTEKLVYSVEKYCYIAKGNMERDTKEALDKQYFDFFMPVEILIEQRNWLKELWKVLLSSENEKKLKWNNKGWLEAKIPISYFEIVKQREIGNSTVSDFRKDYEKFLQSCQKNMEQEIQE